MSYVQINVGYHTGDFNPGDLLMFGHGSLVFNGTVSSTEGDHLVCVEVTGTPFGGNGSGLPSLWINNITSGRISQAYSTVAYTPPVAPPT